MTSSKPNLLINLPPAFFSHPMLRKYFDHLGTIAAVRTSSHDTPEQLAGDLEWASAIIMWSWPVITDSMLEKATALKYLGQINTTGTTARACLKKGVALSEARHCWSPAVAEMGLTLILNGLRKISGYHAAMKQGTEKWVNVFPADIDPQERQLTGRTVGIVGLGGIGQRLAELLKPFAVSLLVYDPYVPEEVVKKAGGETVGIKDLMQRSEVMVLCAATTDETSKLIGPEEISLMQPGSLLVNIGRSSLIDMNALLIRLKQGDITAMLDVFDKEPLEQDSPFRKLPNAFLTPHRAGGLMSSVERALTFLTGDFESHLNGTPRKYAVTERMLPCFPD